MSRFSTLFLDLDDTLYPSSSGVWERISERINRFMEERLSISPQKAQELRQFYLQKYGTTLRGLMLENGVDPEDYLAYVHAIDLEDRISPDPELAAMLEGMKVQRVIFTNASREHAQRVIRALGIQGCVDSIVAIRSLAFQNKPLPAAYRRAMQLSGEADPARCIITDDRVVNLIPAIRMGMTAVQVGDGETDPAVKHHISRLSELVDEMPELRQRG